MGRPRRQVQTTADETCSPPVNLASGEAIARVKKAEGKNLYTVELPSSDEPILVELPARFRSTIWMKRGGYVVIDTSAFADRENRLGGEIVNVVRDEKLWRKQPYWPTAFVKTTMFLEDEDENEESVVGKMPPSDTSSSGE